MERLRSTREASELTGLSCYELRQGWKQGRYPALAIGGKDTKQMRLRWNVSVLMAAIERQMTEKEVEA